MGAALVRTPTAEVHKAFVAKLFVQSFSPPLPAAMIQLQMRAQSADYDARFPNLVDEVLEHEGAPVGRMRWQRCDLGLLVVDVHIDAQHRGKGLGSAALRPLLAEHPALPARLSVQRDNPAQRLYARLGFAVASRNGTHLHMLRPASSSRRSA